MAFREKILWSSVVITLALWGWYFAHFIAAMRVGRFDQGAEVGNFLQIVFLLIVVQAVTAAAIAIASGRDASRPADDREKAIALSAYRPAYFVLSAAMVTLMGAGPVLLRIANEVSPAPPAGMLPVLLGNACLLSLVLAGLVHSGWQIVRYRMGG